MRTLQLVTSEGFGDYALLDSGRGRKLERFGEIIVDRPEPQAFWQRGRPDADWTRAHALFSGDDDEEKGRWRCDRPVPESWPVRVGPATLICRLSSFRHLGLFPEQLPHWTWMTERLQAIPETPPRLLNLFGYTGAASLLAAAAGAHVTHVDASRKAISWARENQAASGLTSAPIRWLLDDAAKFAAREVRRGRTYNGILIDPPKFGRGPDGEIWDLFEHLPGLLTDCAALLAPGNAFVTLTAYAIRASAISFEQLLRDTLGHRSGEFDTGELAILEVNERSGRQRYALPTSMYVRWVGHAA